MPGYTYPAAPASVSGSVAQIHTAMQNPQTVARRLRTLLEQRYVSDALLKGRFEATGGGLFYETGEPIGTGENPRAVAPGGEDQCARAQGDRSAAAADATQKLVRSDRAEDRKLPADRRPEPQRQTQHDGRQRQLHQDQLVHQRQPAAMQPVRHSAQGDKQRAADETRQPARGVARRHR